MINFNPPPDINLDALPDLDFDTLPEPVRQQLRTGLLKFLADIGVSPKIDRKTGELMVSLVEMAQALDKTEAQLRAEMAALGDTSTGLRAIRPEDLESLN